MMTRLDDWQWRKVEIPSLAKFANPKAANLLRLSQNHEQLDATPAGRRRCIELIYQALLARKIRYVRPEYYPESEIQAIRQPIEVLCYPGSGTCLDLALLFCGVCLGYQLLPALIVVEGHALVAVSLRHSLSDWNSYGAARSRFNTLAPLSSSSELKTLIEAGDYLAIECTGFAEARQFTGHFPETQERTDEGFLPFERAIQAGREQLSQPERPFKFAIDLAVAHYGWKIAPLPIDLLTPSTSRSRQSQKYRDRVLRTLQSTWLEKIPQLPQHLQSFLSPDIEEWSSVVVHAAIGAEEGKHAKRTERQPIDIFCESGSLLILGDLGVGKTIALLQIAGRLVERAIADGNHPIPVVLNLASWSSATSKGRDRSSVEDWLTQELRSSYRVPHKATKQWLKAQHLILLLDGLDEVKAQHRNDCIQKINAFLQDYDSIEIIICCRKTEYLAASPLQLQKAICLQLLTIEQVQHYLEHMGEPLEAFRTHLQADPKLRELFRTPLMLSIASAVVNFPQLDSVDAIYKTLYQAYVKRML